ncbi:MAG TPA: L,D-transpeptidase family protein [Ktedonobacteraceae bacterium]|nr:L,D-transpeptidase family protein [Ktedonobacteraceae bacterium]
MAFFTVPRRRVKNSLLVVSMIMLISLLLSACGGDPQTQQKADSSKAKLDSLINQAQVIGVPNALLKPILQQETDLTNTHAPMTFFSGQPATDYYTNLSQRYQMLALQVQGLETQETQQLDYNASQDIQKLENALAERQAQNFTEAKTFAHLLTQYQNQLAKAQYPKDYLQISYNAQQSTQALQLMGPAYSSLTSLQQEISQLQASHLDTAAISLQEQQDMQLFRSAITPDDFNRLINQLNTQIQATSDFSTQAIPYVGAAKLQQFSADLVQLKQYGQDTTSFQQKLTADQSALAQANSISDYLKVSSQIDHDIASLQYAMTVGYASYLLKQYNNEVASWGNSHQYHDPVDGNYYMLDYEYGVNGTGQDGGAALQYAQSTQNLGDYQAAIDIIKNNYLHLKALEADYSDTTPYNQPHATDISLMKHYNVYGPNAGPVLVVSFIEQVLRYYVNGKLVRAFNIVSGQYLKPSPPGFWSIILRQSPTQFKSSEPPGSVFWYPPTPIQYAMEYHSDGYFFHDAWWRANFGKYDNFPHIDASGTTSFNGSGSHGCINMAPSDIAWLYPQIAWGTPVILY